MPMFLCPNCNVGMTQVQRRGVEVDICPQCRGVWLDRGELEKILDLERDARGAQPVSDTNSTDGRPSEKWAHREDHDKDDDRRDDNGRRRKGGFNIFDVFG